MGESYGYQFYPHLTKGEGFFLSVLQKTSGSSPKSLKSGIPFDYFKKLPKKQLAIVQEWLSPNGSLNLIIDPKQRVFAIPKSWSNEIAHFTQVLPHLWPGTWIGTLKKDTFIPSSDLALSTILNSNIPSIEVEKMEALRFLKKETFDLPTPITGWHLVKYQDLGLGWIKGVKKRFNNYYPKEWRIRMKLPNQ